MSTEDYRRTHALTPDGESTEKWAFNDPGFAGSIRQLINCARCGEVGPPKGPNEPRHYTDLLKPTMHFLCDECFDALP